MVMGGRLVHWKGHDLVLEGFARYVRQRVSPCRLVITGVGPYRPVLTDMVQRLQVGAQVDFVGRLPSRADVCDLLRTCSLYALPTLRDGPPVAILEAMSLGLPILCLKLGSTDEMLPDSAGFKINARSREQVVTDIAAALAWAATHRAELRQMGLNARAHVAEFYNWDRIGREVQGIYEETLKSPGSEDPR